MVTWGQAWHSFPKQPRGKEKHEWTSHGVELEFRLNVFEIISCHTLGSDRCCM